MIPDEIDWEWQRGRLQVRLSEVDGDAFETLFQDIAGALWGTAFQPTIPMGSRGDLKCDGFHYGTGTCYQCFGPRYGRVEVDDALSKIDADFCGAKDHWQGLLQRWCFVLGVYRDKTPSEIVRKVGELSAELEVPAEILHRDHIIDLAHDIEASKRVEMFGKAPLPADMIRRVSYENIGRALAFIRADSTASPTELIPLPPDINTKIAFNMLPDSVRHFLTVGATSADNVKNYLLARAEPDEADRMAEGFSRRYAAVKAAGAEPAEIFQQMVVFAGGATGQPDREAAALAIVTHFFMTCEIFERPPSEQGT
jgi:hypothetical protein